MEAPHRKARLPNGNRAQSHLLTRRQRLATSRLEARIVDQFWWPNREHLSERMTRIVEKGQPTTAGFQHGVLRDPDGELTEFALPDLQLATPSSVRTNA